MTASSSGERETIVSAKSCVERNTPAFIEHVIKDIDLWHRKGVHGKNVAFAQFGLADENYYLYGHAARALEAIARETLINPSLAALLHERGVRAVWLPCDSRSMKYDNVSYESRVPYEFIIDGGEARIGYRYTDPDCDFETLLEEMRKYGVDETVVIDWRSEAPAFECVTEEDISLSWTTSRDFFLTYLGEGDYEGFVAATTDAIATAREQIGLEVVPQLSFAHLAQLKKDIEKEVLATSNSTLFYEQRPGRKARQLTIAPKDYSIVKKCFYDRGFFRALLGESGFAKCFMTAEHMFRCFSEGSKIDYTVVAAGYLKAVEQFEYQLMEITLSKKLPCRLWMKSKLYRKDLGIAPDEEWRVFSGKLHIAFKREYECYFDINQGSLSYFLRYNKYGWNVSHAARESIFNALDEFRDECRNGHFHRDNINEYEEVLRIRKNALTIFFYLLGGYKITDSKSESVALLEMRYEKYQRFYHEMRKAVHRNRKIAMQFGGEEPVVARRRGDIIASVYDESGVPVTEIVFDVEDAACQERVVRVARDCCPDKAWFLTPSGRKQFL